MKAFLHRQVWQRLPKGPRRALLFSATRALAPRVSADARPCEPIVVAGPLRTATGLGRSAQLCYEAFRACGVRAYAVDLTSALGYPVDIPDYAFEDGRSVTGAGTLILHVNSPFVPLALLRLGRPLVEGKWVIGYWHWELLQAPADWRHGVSRIHEIWTPSRFTASAVKSVVGTKPIRILPHPVALGVQSAPRDRAAGLGLTAMVAFNMASGFARKNPLASIAAFKAAFGNDPQNRLVVKVAHAESYPDGHHALQAAIDGMANGILIDRMIDDASMKALYAQTDVVMSLHRSEGFGLVVAESMLSALPVLSTDWSATTDFLTTETGVPVNYRLVPAIDPQGQYHQPLQQWADADIEDAAAKLVALRSPLRRRAIGEAAQGDAAKRFSAHAYVKRAFEWIGRPSQAGNDGAR
jgi:glycosyltransferase involved in cell wall biosynthesis